MDIKKIDKIKAPEDWVEEALNPEKIQGISHRRNSMKKLRTAAAAVVIFLLCGTFVTVAATKSNVFQSLLENMFGKENVQNQRNRWQTLRRKKMARYNYRKT